MHEYVQPMKDSVFKSATDKKISKINKRGIPCKDVTGDFFDNVRVQRKLREPLQLQVQGDFNLKNDLFPQYKKKNIIQLKPIADYNSRVVQFTVGGINKAEWLKRHRLKGKKRELFADFFDMVHMQSDFIFFGHELDSYYEQYEKENYAVIDQDALRNFDLFKKHVAMIRDPEGAHGAQRHTHDPQAGSQYIVDRVFAPHGPGKASYLPVDIYLQWDNKLIMHHEAIFNKYIELVRDLIYDTLPTINQYRGDIGGARATITGLESNGGIDISDSEKLTLSVSFAAQSLTMQADGFQVRMPASIQSNQQVTSISVTRKDANEQGIHGIKHETKKPEAYTGSLAPVFIIADGEIVNQASITSDMLKWVTKF